MRIPKRHICPWLLTAGIITTGVVHYVAPEVEGYMACVVGIAWAWSIPDV